VRRIIGSHLAVMMLATTVTFGLGVAQKAQCMTRQWVEDKTGVAFLCDTDIPHLYAWEQLTGTRLPYLDPCTTPAANRQCDEYPAGTMYLMRGVASATGDGGDPYWRFSWAATLILYLCALWITWSLERMGARTVLFAAAPVLVTGGTLNWDLVPVAFATAGTLAFLRGRDTRSGALLGLGAFVKLYPGLLAVPFALDRLRAGARDRATRLIAVTAGAWVIANLPFAILAFAGWAVFFRFNSHRPPDFDSLWEVLCHLHLCPPTAVVNVASVALTAAGTWWSWRAAERRSEGLPIWISAFPILVMVLLTGKVWSSQYSLWLLPWFAVTSVPWFLFVEYQLAEVAEYLVRYHYFGTVISGHGISYWVLGAIVLIRAALLLRCLMWWIHQRSRRSPRSHFRREPGRPPRRLEVRSSEAA
jgi:hypothetical protein